MKIFSVILTSFLLQTAFAGPLTITPPTQQVHPGDLVILTANELVNWSSSAGTLGSVQGTRVVLQAPTTSGNVTVTIQDPREPGRKAFAVVQVQGLTATASAWRTRTFAAGDGFSVAISTDGSVWAWGLNTDNQVSGGNGDHVALPTRIEGLSNIKSVVASTYSGNFSDRGASVLALAQNGNVWAWGSSRPTPSVFDKNIQAISFGACAVTSKGNGEFSVYSQYDRRLLPGGAKDISFVLSAESGSMTSGGIVAIDKVGHLLRALSCIDPLRIVPETEHLIDVVPVASNAYIALRTDGSAILVTADGVSDLAGFEGIRKIAASASKPGHGDPGVGYLIMRNGELRSFQIDLKGIPTVPRLVQSLTGIVDVSVSPTHALFLRVDGTLMAYGSNTNGQLGDGTTQTPPAAVQVVGLQVALPETP